MNWWRPARRATIWTPDGGARPLNARFVKIIELAGKLGVRNIGISSGAVPEQPFGKQVSMIVKLYEERYFPACEKYKVRLLWEPHVNSGNVATRTANFAALFQAFNNTPNVLARLRVRIFRIHGVRPVGTKVAVLQNLPGKKRAFRHILIEKSQKIAMLAGQPRHMYSRDLVVVALGHFVWSVPLAAILRLLPASCKVLLKRVRSDELGGTEAGVSWLCLLQTVHSHANLRRGCRSRVLI